MATPEFLGAVRHEAHELLAQVVATLDASELAAEFGEDVAQLRQHAHAAARAPPLRIVVVGGVNSGKSTLLNALCTAAGGRATAADRFLRLLPTSVSAETQAFWHVRPDPTPQFYVRGDDGIETVATAQTHFADVAELEAATAEKARSVLGRLHGATVGAAVAHYTIYAPIGPPAAAADGAGAAAGFEFVDTPGIGEGRFHQEIQAEIARPGAPAVVVYCISLLKGSATLNDDARRCLWGLLSRVVGAKDVVVRESTRAFDHLASELEAELRTGLAAFLRDEFFPTVRSRVVEADAELGGPYASRSKFVSDLSQRVRAALQRQLEDGATRRVQEKVAALYRQYNRTAARPGGPPVLPDAPDSDWLESHASAGLGAVGAVVGFGAAFTESAAFGAALTGLAATGVGLLVGAAVFGAAFGIQSLFWTRAEAVEQVVRLYEAQEPRIAELTVAAFGRAAAELRAQMQQALLGEASEAGVCAYLPRFLDLRQHGRHLNELGRLAASLSAPEGPGAAPPRELVCPIGHELMAEPLLAPDGFSYDAEEIRRWLGTQGRSPMTNAELRAEDLRPNPVLERLIAHWRAHAAAAGAQAE